MGEMHRESLKPRVIKKGDPPPCLHKGIQCRGCYGWENLIKAARSNPRWRSSRLHCCCTGLTVILD